MPGERILGCVSSNWKSRRRSMRRQSELLSSHVPLMVLWKKHQVTALLAQGISMSIQRLWPYLRTEKRLRLHAVAEKEQTVTLRALLNLACAVINVLRCPLRGSQQG